MPFTFMNKSLLKLLKTSEEKIEIRRRVANRIVELSTIEKIGEERSGEKNREVKREK